MSPLVSVVMPTYNSERFLREAMESILNQTFEDFEFIIVADKSTDTTDAILDDLQEKDDRIKVFDQERIGLIAALNKGCRIAKGKYIARMDADDVSLPNRLEKQVQYMEEHPEIGVLGTGIRYIDEIGRSGNTLHNPINPNLVKFYLHLENCIVHPSVMMRRDIIEQLGFYNPDAKHAEDYDLWARACSITQIANLHDVLLEYRIWIGGISSHNSLLRDQTDVRIRQSIINKLLGSEVPVDSIATPFRIANSSLLGIVTEMGKVAGLILPLYIAYLRNNDLSRREAINTAYLALAFSKNILKEIVIVKFGLSKARISDDHRQ
ncbi:Glycosyltransferase AglG [uncultured archaeon]|nr:Glycosyltransferase AglG [uncultured archaeon]